MLPDIFTIETERGCRGTIVTCQERFAPLITRLMFESTARCFFRERCTEE